MDIPTPEEIVREMFRSSYIGKALRRHLAPPLIEDLEQAIAAAIRKDRERTQDRVLRELGRELG